MPVSSDVNFRNLDASPAVTERVNGLVRRLNRVYPEMLSCRVVIELLSRRHQQGNVYKVSIDVRVPNAQIVVGRHSGSNPAHADVYVAIRDAFDQMRRQLAARAQRGQGKALGHSATAIRISEPAL
jgi:ribosomal subunit interface protein